MQILIRTPKNFLACEACERAWAHATACGGGGPKHVSFGMRGSSSAVSSIVCCQFGSSFVVFGCARNFYKNCSKQTLADSFLFNLDNRLLFQYNDISPFKKEYIIWGRKRACEKVASLFGRIFGPHHKNCDFSKITIFPLLKTQTCIGPHHKKCGKT